MKNDENEEAIAAGSKEEFEQFAKTKINKKALKGEGESESADEETAESIEGEEGAMEEESVQQGSEKEPIEAVEATDEEIASAGEQLLKEKKDYYQRIKDETKKYKNIEIVATAKATYLLYELPFFKLEPYMLIAVTIISISIVALSVIGIVEPVFGLLSFGLMAMVTWGLWGIKKFFYMPNRKRFPVLKVFGSGLGALACEKIDESKVWFNKNIAPTVVTNYRAMTEMFTGYPLIIAFEGYFENIDLPKMMKGKADLRLAERLKATLDEALEQGARKERMKQQSVKKSLMDNPVAWIAFAILAVLLLYIFFIAMPQADFLSKLSEAIDSVGGIQGLKDIAAVAKAGGGGGNGATVVTAGGG